MAEGDLRASQVEVDGEIVGGQAVGKRKLLGRGFKRLQREQHGAEGGVAGFDLRGKLDDAGKGGARTGEIAVLGCREALLHQGFGRGQVWFGLGGRGRWREADGGKAGDGKEQGSRSRPQH